MDNADKKLIDEWRGQTASQWHNWIANSIVAALIAAFDRALADTPTLVEIPAQWCRTHRKTLRATTATCCFNSDGPNEGCDLRPLVYREQP